MRPSAGFRGSLPTANPAAAATPARPAAPQVAFPEQDNLGQAGGLTKD